MAIEDLKLGRGRVFFQREGENSERYVGNTPEFNLSVEQETLDHYSSDAGTKVKDASVTLSTDRSASIVAEEISPENIAFMLLGESGVLSEAGESVTNEAISQAIAGRHYQLGTSATRPSGAKGVENVVVNNGGSALTEGTDYILDADRGRIFITETGSITAPTDLVVTYDIRSSSRPQIITGSEAIRGTLRYISENAHGSDVDWFFPSVIITPNGDFGLKGDDWTNMSLSVEILKPENLEAIYADGEPKFA